MDIAKGSKEVRKMDAGAVVYEVNLTVRQEVAAEYCDWLKHHIVEMMKIDGFLSYTWCV